MKHLFSKFMGAGACQSVMKRRMKVKLWRPNRIPRVTVGQGLQRGLVLECVFPWTAVIHPYSKTAAEAFLLLYRVRAAPLEDFLFPSHWVKKFYALAAAGAFVADPELPEWGKVWLWSLHRSPGPGVRTCVKCGASIVLYLENGRLRGKCFTCLVEWDVMNEVQRGWRDSEVEKKFPLSA